MGVGGGTRKKKHINAIVGAERQVRRTCAFFSMFTFEHRRKCFCVSPLFLSLSQPAHNIRERLYTSLFSPPSTLCSTVASAEHAALVRQKLKIPCDVPNKGSPFTIARHYLWKLSCNVCAPLDASTESVERRHIASRHPPSRQTDCDAEKTRLLLASSAFKLICSKVPHENT